MHLKLLHMHLNVAWLFSCMLFRGLHAALYFTQLAQCEGRSANTISLPEIRWLLACECPHLT